MTAEEKREYNRQYYLKNKERLLEQVKQYQSENKERIAERKKRYRKDNKERIAEKNKQYYQDNKERLAEYNKQYQSENKERIAEQRKQYRKDNKERIAQYYQDNKERLAEYNKQYRSENKERILEYQKKYREENRELIAERWKKCYSTKKGRAGYVSNAYKKIDIRKGFSIDQNIDADWIIENIFGGQKCIYCGDNDWTHLGADRIDNTKPHTPDNVVCACFICNVERNDRCSVEEFKQYRALHPRDLSCMPEKNWEIAELPNGTKVIKKK